MCKCGKYIFFSPRIKHTVFSISHHLLGQEFTNHKHLKSIQIPMYEPLSVSSHENDMTQCHKSP